MKIWVHPYKLEARHPKVVPRIGALLKVEWALHQVGYSDLHPWPEFGEQPLDVHLESLAAIDFTKLAEISMEFNYIDREYRLLKRNAFLGLILPRCHKLVYEVDRLEASTCHQWAKQGFSHIKVKMGDQLQAETAAFLQLAMSTDLMWRIDFNGKLTSEQFLSWWRGLDESVRARIDFIEDPVGVEEHLKIAGPWANDWRKQKTARIRVVKPAREAADQLAAYDRMVFTHGLDHSFGQACAAWSAGRFYAEHPKMNEVCGLAAARIYADDEFSKAWFCEGPRLKPTPGTGFGFDEILESLKWERIL
jgi:O-succinylbenzoate synthase